VRPAPARPFRSPARDVTLNGDAALLRQAALRVTPQRLAVLRTLAGGKHVKTCQEIWARARRDAGGLGLVSVYRILQGLEAAGIAERVQVGSAARFGLAHRGHDHAICERCGAVEPIESRRRDSVADGQLAERGFLVRRHRLDVFGVCRACRRRITAP
jgi:Fur family transcriptional regulator, ferric uptake regulator